MAGSHHRRRRPSYCKRRRRRRHHPYRPRDRSYTLHQQDSSGSISMADEQDDDVYIPMAVSLMDIDITSWLPLFEMGGAWRWCSNRVSQSLDWMRDAVFPSRAYRRELQETKDQLLLLHQQIEQLKAQSLKVAKTDIPNPACCCKCQHPMPTITAPAEQQYPAGQTIAQPAPPTTTNHTLEQAGGHVAPPAPPAVIPPLPLPPPPPPPPPPPISLPTKALVFKKKKTTETTSKGDASNKRVMVTLSDIMNVKLKKVSDPEQMEAMQASIDPRRRGVVTLSDIQNIQLKKTYRKKKALPSGLFEVSRDDIRPVRLSRRRSFNQMNDENSNSHDHSMVLRSRITQEAMQFRGCLRKVSMVRSPGGTPLREKREQGTGLTPLMTKALRRKFKTIRTPSPSAADGSTISPSFTAST